MKYIVLIVMWFMIGYMWGVSDSVKENKTFDGLYNFMVERVIKLNLE